jgi:hypothetical protein
MDMLRRVTMSPISRNPLLWLGKSPLFCVRVFFLRWISIYATLNFVAD